LQISVNVDQSHINRHLPPVGLDTPLVERDRKNIGATKLWSSFTKFSSRVTGKTSSVIERETNGETPHI